MFVDTLRLKIKKLLLKQLNENDTPFYHLAPDVVGSINNAYPTNKGKMFVINFTTIDENKGKLKVPHVTYQKFCSSKNCKHSVGMAMAFTNAFISNAQPVDGTESGGLDEIVDEFGDLYQDNDDLPLDLKSSPGQQQTKNSISYKNQIAPSYSKVFSTNMGYGALTW